MSNDSFFQWKGDADLGMGYMGLPKGNVISIVTATLTVVAGNRR